MPTDKTLGCDLGKIWELHSRKYNNVWWPTKKFFDEPTKWSEGKEAPTSLSLQQGLKSSIS